MKCPYCSNAENKVIDSRINQQADIIRRRRECLRCEGRFTTYERVEVVMPVVIKKDGRREPFNRDKILTGMTIACQKRSIAMEDLEEAATKIEKKIQSFGLKEIPSQTVGRLVMASLHQLDKVAYIRFASVYREFRDVEEFVAELQENPENLDEGMSLTFPFVEPPSENQ